MNAEPLEVGAVAPGVSAPNQDAKVLDLGEEFKTGTTLVYFYPKSDTPGCTKQACGLRDAFLDLQKLGVKIYGVSTDKPESQKKFQEKYNLPFPLIADTEKKVCEAFGVPALTGFAKRQSFLIRDGKIIWRDLNAATATHSADVLKAVQSSTHP